MHRLLTRKGYLFPEISASDAAVLNPAENLQSAAELEQEERDAQEAKLQELIRRGTPADLQEANRLMKIMAGFQGDKKSDYRAKVAEEVDKLRRKAEILDEMLANITPGDDLPDDDVFSDIVSSLKTSVPKLKALAEEESEDEEAVAKLLALNDYARSLLEKYKYFKQKDIGKATSVQVARPSNVEITKGQNAAPQNSISLIDFDDEPAAPVSDKQAASSGSLDLLSELGGLSLGGAPSSSSNIMNSTSSSTTTKSNQDILAAFGSSSVSPPSPMFAQNSTLDSIFSNTTTTTNSSSFPTSSPSVSVDTDEWNFVSAAPPPPPAPSQFTLFDDSTVSVAGTVARDSSLPSGAVHINLLFSNKSPVSGVSNLNVQLAVKRDLQIKVDALSATTLGKLQRDGVSQHTLVEGVGSDTAVKLRWIVTYEVNGQAVSRDGIANLPKV